MTPFRLLLALLFAVLAGAGAAAMESSPPPPSSGVHADPADPVHGAVLHARGHTAVAPTARRLSTGPDSGRPDDGAVRHTAAPGLYRASPAPAPHLLRVSARTLAAQRDGTLSSRSNGVPPPPSA